MAKNGGSSRLRTTIRDMVLSMSLIVLPILLVLWLILFVMYRKKFFVRI